MSMTENEAIEELKTSIGLAKMCTLNSERKKEIEAYAMAIQALEEIQAYRAIGTIEEFKQAMYFKEYFMELYEEGLEVANWHENGDLEPLTEFIDSALDWSE